MNIRNCFIALIILVSSISLIHVMEDPKEKHLECVRNLIRQALHNDDKYIIRPIGEDENAISPLMVAILDIKDKARIDRVRVLLEYGANVQAKTSDGDTPLHILASEDYDDVIDWGVTINNKKQVLRSCQIISLLMDYGANIEQLNDSSETPLMKAVRQRRLDAVKSLLLYGASTEWVWSWQNKPDDKLSLQEQAGKNIMESLEVSRRSNISIIDFDIYLCLMNPTFEIKSNNCTSETLFEQKQWIQKQLRHNEKSQYCAEQDKSIFYVLRDREFNGRQFDSKRYQTPARKRKQSDRDKEISDTRKKIKRRRLTFEG
jgi:ankyrin repeat protein